MTKVLENYQANMMAHMATCRTRTAGSCRECRNAKRECTRSIDPLDREGKSGLLQASFCAECILKSRFKKHRNAQDCRDFADVKDGPRFNLLGTSGQGRDTPPKPSTSIEFRQSKQNVILAEKALEIVQGDLGDENAATNVQTTTRKTQPTQDKNRPLSQQTLQPMMQSDITPEAEISMPPLLSMSERFKQAAKRYLKQGTQDKAWFINKKIVISTWPRGQQTSISEIREQGGLEGLLKHFHSLPG